MTGLNGDNNLTWGSNRRLALQTDFLVLLICYFNRFQTNKEVKASFVGMLFHIGLKPGSLD